MRSVYLYLFLFSSALVGAKEVTVSVTTPQLSEYTPTISVHGRLASKAQQKLSFKVSGLVQHVAVEEGQQVNKGDLLASLDQQEITAQQQQAHAVFTNTQDNLARAKRLYQQGLISNEMLNNAQTEFDVARSDLTIATFNLKHAEIRASGDGLVLKRYIEPNELVSPGQTAFLLSNQDAGWVLRGAVTDRHILNLHVGQSAVVTLDAYDNTEFDATVSETAAAADPTTGLFEIELRLQPTDKTLLSGFVASAKVFTDNTETVYLLPVASIVSGNKNSIDVFLLNSDNIARLATLQIAFIQANTVAVRTPLPANTRIVVNGASFVRDGMRVQIGAEGQP